MWRRLRARLRPVLKRQAADRDLDDEIAFHIERQTAKYLGAGLDPVEARRRALAAFGGVQQTRETHRAVRGLPRLEDAWRDVHYGVRGLSRSPLFAATAVVTLSLGIATTTVVVSAVRALVFPTMPVTRPDRLYNVWQVEGAAGTPNTSMGLAMYPGAYVATLRSASRNIFDDVAGYAYNGVSLRAGNDARPLSAVIVTPNYFDLLGIRPALGRFLTFRRDRPDLGQPEAVLAYDLWKSGFGGDSAIIGRVIHVDSRPLTVTGIAPKGFRGIFIGIIGEIWISSPAYDGPPPAVTDSALRARHDGVNMTVFGRLRDGVTVSQAEASLGVVVSDPYPDRTYSKAPTWRVRLDPVAALPRMGKAEAAGFTAMLASVAALVLAIVATNIAGMLLARATARRREVAIRLAIGAGRGRIVRQLAIESLVLCLAGAGGGLLVARALISLIPAVQAPVSARLGLELPIDKVVLGIAILASVATGLFAGLAPALQATRFDVNRALRGASEGTGRPGRLRTLLVVTQFAMSLALLVTAGLFMRALQRALTLDPGFDPTNVVVGRVDLAPHGYTTARGRAFYAELEARLRARPEVRSVGLGIWTPLSGGLNGSGVLLPGEPWPNGHRVGVRYGVADSGYFATLRIPLLAGRSFSESDAAGAAPSLIVNQALATAFWPNESPLGRSINVETGGNPNFPRDREVVGMVRTAKVQSLGESPVPYAYLPLGQRYSSALLVYARATRAPLAALEAVRAVVRDLDPNIALQQAMPLEQQLDVYVLPQRVAAWFVSALGLAGLGLAALGVYGMVAYHVAQRTREFGIRLALGARGRDVVGLAQRHALRLAVIGSAAGVAIALGIARLVAAFLFGIRPFDMFTFAGVCALLAGTAFLASWLPARRAARVDPMESLRVE